MEARGARLSSENWAVRRIARCYEALLKHGFSAFAARSPRLTASVPCRRVCGRQYLLAILTVLFVALGRSHLLRQDQAAGDALAFRVYVNARRGFGIVRIVTHDMDIKDKARIRSGLEPMHIVLVVRD